MAATADKYSQQTLNQPAPIQLVQNGNFANGTTGWTRRVTNDDWSVSGGILTITKGQTSLGAFVYQSPSVLNTTHKYYMAATARTLTPNVAVYIGFHASNYTVSGNSECQTTSTSFVRISQITSPKANTNIFALRLGIASSAIGSQGEVGDVVLIDLTDTYGSGNEPSKTDFETAYGLGYLPYNADGSVELKLAMLPLALTEYESDSKFKLLFYLDDVFHYVDSDNKQCVVGLLKNDSTTAKYQHHASKRLGRLGMTKQVTIGQGDHINNIILNDGGLNTTADCKFHTGRPASGFTNFIKFIVDLYSAYYVDTTQFHIWLYRKESNAWAYYYDWTIMITSDSAVLAAKGKKEEFVTYRDGTFGGLNEGDEMRAILTSENSEGKYPNYAGSYPTPTEAANMPSGTYLDFIVRGALNFTQLYYHSELSGNNPPNQNTQPITNRPYAMIVSEDMYDYNPNFPLQGGILGRLFAGQTENWIGLDSTTHPKGCVGTIEDAYEATSYGDLADGFYFGVPTTWGGSDLAYIRIDNNRICWYANQYASTDYTLRMTFEGSRSNGVITINVYANLTGSWNHQNTTITTNVYIMGRVDTWMATYSQAASSSKVLMGTFTTTTDNAYLTKNSTGSPAPNNVDSQTGYISTQDEGSISTILIPDTDDQRT